jgi:hypothetical protein
LHGATVFDDGITAVTINDGRCNESKVQANLIKRNLRVVAALHIIIIIIRRKACRVVDTPQSIIVSISRKSDECCAVVGLDKTWKITLNSASIKHGKSRSILQIPGFKPVYHGWNGNQTQSLDSLLFYLTISTTTTFYHANNVKQNVKTDERSKSATRREEKKRGNWLPKREMLSTGSCFWVYYISCAAEKNEKALRWRGGRERSFFFLRKSRNRSWNEDTGKVSSHTDHSQTSVL